MKKYEIRVVILSDKTAQSFGIGESPWFAEGVTKYGVYYRNDAGELRHIKDFDKPGDAGDFLNLKFRSWAETHYMVSSMIGHYLTDVTDLNLEKFPVLKETQATGGIFAVSSLAERITDLFEEKNMHRVWDGEFLDEISDFVDSQLMGVPDDVIKRVHAECKAVYEAVGASRVHELVDAYKRTEHPDYKHVTYRYCDDCDSDQPYLCGCLICGQSV